MRFPAFVHFHLQDIQVWIMLIGGNKQEPMHDQMGEKEECVTPIDARTMCRILSSTKYSLRESAHA